MTDTRRPAGARVLVVDDDPDILEPICDILEDEGYRVARARNGAEALDQVGHETPDLIVLDLMMPVMDGYAFARALRSDRGADHIPIIVISADGSPERAWSLGASAFLAKPFTIDQLLDEVGAARQGGARRLRDAPRKTVSARGVP